VKKVAQKPVAFYLCLSLKRLEVMRRWMRQ
jgi:hypothetical protein